MKKRKGQDLIPVTGKRKQDSYSLEIKGMAVSFLDAIQRDFNGEMIPHYAKVSEYLNIPETTLKGWYAKRDEISSMASINLVELPKATILMLNTEALRIVQELKERGYSNISTRDLTNLFATYVTKMRLLSGKSTQNVGVNVAYSPVFPTGRKPVRVTTGSLVNSPDPVKEIPADQAANPGDNKTD
jgi:hypothetical protein